MSTRILQGDVRDVLKGLEPDSIDCVVTSPPYWGLRSYLADDHPDKVLEIGSEPTLVEHIAVLVEVFREVRRVMKSQATLWLNYGDCYATKPAGWSAARYKTDSTDDRTFRDKPFSTIGGVLKPKDLCMIPARLAIALQEDGWWVRSEIVWGKPNPMPDSSGKYRPSTAHEKIYMLAKSAKCFYDAEAVARPCSAATHERLSQNVRDQIGSDRANGGRKTNGNMKAVVRKQDGHSRRHDGFNGRSFGKVRDNKNMDSALAIMPETRYLRNYEPAACEVWEMATQPFSEAHYATFPPELVERCLRAGCPPGGVVLDPFGGAGTVGLVADRMRLSAILIELNRESIDIASHRLHRDAGMFAEVAAE